MDRILVVVDMQNDFIDGALGTPEARAVLLRVLEKASRFEGTVVFTRDTHEEDYLQTQEGKHLPVPHCIRGSDGWQLAPALERLRVGQNCAVFDKPAFGSAALAGWLAERHAKQPIASVEFIGVCTEICVISNALLAKAFLPEVPVLVDAACCSGTSPESHRAALAVMKACQIQVMSEGEQDAPTG